MKRRCSLSSPVSPPKQVRDIFFFIFSPEILFSSKSLGSVTCTRGARCHSGECGDQGHCGTAVASHVGEEPSCAASLVLGSGSLVECVGGVSLLLRYIVCFFRRQLSATLVFLPLLSLSSGHLCHEVLELVAAHVYVYPTMAQAPNSALAGFYQALVR